MKRLLTIAAVALFFSCSDSKSDTDKSKEETKTESTKTDESTTTSSGDVQDDPVKVMQAVFDAAKAGDYSKLTSLCPPDGSGDGDTKSICNIGSAGTEEKAEFKEYFQDGKVDGQAEIEGNSAKVKILFGKGGSESETMSLQKIDGKWYLMSF